jgi:hypothetical protein
MPDLYLIIKSENLQKNLLWGMVTNQIKNSGSTRRRNENLKDLRHKRFTAEDAGGKQNWSSQ